ncbi:MAG TPA: hypothetical protein VGM51_15255 [Armatimonadota bacterium]|jgi:hypothetical protein
MKRIQWLLAAGIAATSLAPGPLAQGPPNGQMPAAMRTKMKAWASWRKTHKNFTALEQTIRGLEMIQEDRSTRLSKPQAKTVAGVLKAWRHKKVMTNTQAGKVNKQIIATLNVPQLKKIAAGARPNGGGPGGPGGPPPGGFGGPPPGAFGGPPPGGPGGPLPRGMGGPPPGGPGGPPPGGPGAFPGPKEYNPLNPDTLPFAPERPRMKNVVDGLIKTLAAQGK